MSERLPAMTFRGRELIQQGPDGQLFITDHRLLLEMQKSLKVAEKYVKDCQDLIKAAVLECGSPLLEVVEQGSGRDFKETPHYEELPEKVRAVVSELEYDSILTASVTGLESLFVDGSKRMGVSTKAAAKDSFRSLTSHLVEARKPRQILKEKRDGS